VIAGKAVAFGEALDASFKTYIDNVLANASALGEVLKEGGVDLVTGGTDNHLLLVDLRPKGLKGTQVEQALERAGITCNKNGIPFDTEKPTVTSGIRLGTPAGTTRGFGVAEFREIGRLILEVFEALRTHPEGDAATEQRVRREIFALCERFPIYGAAQ
jgi:glycine hydroxymethyltransferase